jgi:hypothetical protein
MLGTNARRIIAMMTDQRLRRNDTDPGLIGRTMSRITAATETETAIAKFIRGTRPQITITHRVGTRTTKKTLAKRFTGGTGETRTLPTSGTARMKIASASASATEEHRILLRNTALLTDTHCELLIKNGDRENANCEKPRG